MGLFPKPVLLIALGAVIFALAVVSHIDAQSELNKSADELNMAQVRRAIDTGNAHWIAAWKTADAQLIAAQFAEDATQFAPKGHTVRGRAAIQERFADVFKRTGPALDYTIKTLEVWLVDDLAYESGNYTGKIQPQGKEAATFSGKYVTVWKRQADNSWKIYIDFSVPE
jgi:uncharacterized protein (TIGR02246 family)